MKIKTKFKKRLSASPALVWDLQCFLLYYFCQNHNSLISSRPSWRQRAGFAITRPCGLVKDYVDEGVQKRTIYFDMHSF